MPTISVMHELVPVTQAPPDLPLRPQDEVECRRCEVHCDKVVYPARASTRACPFVYAYEAFGHTYIGCMQKVFEVEIDLDLLREAEARRDGFGAVGRCGSRCRCARSRSRRATSTAPTSSAAATRSSLELPLERPSFRVFAQLAD